jgi:hypothetical protein
MRTARKSISVLAPSAGAERSPTTAEGANDGGVSKRPICKPVQNRIGLRFDDATSFWNGVTAMRYSALEGEQPARDPASCDAMIAKA